MSSYESFVNIIDTLSIESLSFSRRKKRSKNDTLTSEIFDEDDLIANRRFNVRQLERCFSKSNWNVA
jgi:hypothetical protein